MLPALAAAAIGLTQIQPPHSDSGHQLVAAIPRDLPAVNAERRSYELFGFPLIARVAVVQRNPQGLSSEAQSRAILQAVQLNLHQLPGLEDIAGALPVTNALSLFPGSSEDGTTLITYLLFRPDVSVVRQVKLAQSYADQYLNQPSDGTVGITGAVPLRYTAGEKISTRLPLLEIASVVLVTIIVAVAFRSVLAPIVVLLPAALALYAALTAVGWLDQISGFTTPSELRPLITVLIFGVTADYAVFYLSSFRSGLERGLTSRDAVHDTASGITPIVLAAAATIAGTSLTVLLARLEFFQSAGPGMAAAVAIAGITATLGIPALLGLFKERVFWPSHPGGTAAIAPPGRSTGLLRHVTAAASSGVGRLVVLLLVLALLARGVYALSGYHTAMNLIDDLPSSAAPARAADAAAMGFSPGIVAPTIVLAQSDGIGNNKEALHSLQSQISGTPGVAGVLGAGTSPFDQPQAGIFVSQSADAARFVVILADDPYSPAGMATLDRLESASDRMLRQAGVSQGSLTFAGDTAISAQISSRANMDLFRVCAGIFIVDALILALYLRAFLVAVMLLLTNALTLAAAIGLTVWVFEGPLGASGLTYYVPFGVVVLLSAFTTDYTLFVVGRIWEAGEQRTLRQALLSSNPRSTPAAAIAGIGLALTFGLLVVIPLATFREVALAICAGVLIDTLLIQPLVVPALLSLLGEGAATWPGRHFRALRRDRE